MESLIRLLLILTTRAQFNSESDREDAFDLLRAVEVATSVSGVVPPKPSPTNAPRAEEVAVEPPGPVAEPVPPAEQTPPPTSPEVAGASESNAFGQQ
jgi:hypothetical protein